MTTEETIYVQKALLRRQDRRIRELEGREMSEAIRMLMSAHYYLMSNPRFWYDKSLQDASRILCVTASDMRLAMREATPNS